jgi:hypothetical protein
MPVPQGVIILGSLAAFFLCMMAISAALKYYFGKKAAEDEANASITSTWGPSASSPGPAAASDVEDERAKLIKGDDDLVGAKTIQLDEVDINVVSPPSIPDPFTINATTPPDYTISFDIKVEKNLPMNGTFTILDRGGNADDNTGRRPWVQLVTTSRNDRRCAADITELQGLEGLGNFAGSQGSGGLNQVRFAPDTAGCQKVDNWVVDHTNTIRVIHKAATTPFPDKSTTVGPQAGQDFKNCTIVVKSRSQTEAEIKIFWDSVLAVESQVSEFADWGSVVSKWRWAGGQTAPNANIGSVKIKNAYIFGRALDDSEVAILLYRGANAESTYAVEPTMASWKFNPSGYASD